ncbi:MAG: hypothetical protein IJ785_07045 [Bacteroidales bacterium]|nr:hypothetical protein [Bacteroidales bacterium]
MQTNDGSIGAAISDDDSQKRSFRTLPIEVVFSAGVIAICIFLMIQWHKTPNNTIEVESGYIGPQSEQILGMKVVRDYNINSTARFKFTDSMISVSPKYNHGLSGLPKPNSVSLPGIHVGVMTRMFMPCDKPLFAGTSLPTAYIEDGPYCSFVPLQSSIIGRLANTDFSKDNLGLYSSLYIKANKRVGLSHFDERGYSSIIPNFSITVKPKSVAHEHMVIYGNQISSVIDTIHFLSAFFDNRIEDTPLLQLFGYNPSIYDMTRISQETLTDMYFSQGQKDTIDSLGYVGQLRQLEFKSANFKRQSENLNLVLNKDSSFESNINVAAQILANGLVLYDQSNSLYNKAIAEKMFPLKRYVDSLIDKNMSYGNALFGANNNKQVEVPRGSILSESYSILGQHHQLKEVSYFSSSFTKPGGILSLYDLSKVQEHITIKHSANSRLMKFEYDFRTHIDGLICSAGAEAIRPNDIILTSTGFVITNPKVLEAIMNNGLSVSVHFPDWDNRQTERFFFVTLIITLMFSYLFKRLVEQKLLGRLEKARKKNIVIIAIVLAVIFALIIPLIVLIF